MGHKQENGIFLLTRGGSWVRSHDGPYSNIPKNLRVFPSVGGGGVLLIGIDPEVFRVVL